MIRFNAKINVRIGLEAMVDGLGWKLTRDFDFDVENKALRVESALKHYRSRAKIMKVALEAIASEGSAVWVWSDDCAAADEIREQARALVLRKFPELRPLRLTA